MEYYGIFQNMCVYIFNIHCVKAQIAYGGIVSETFNMYLCILWYRERVVVHAVLIDNLF